MGEPTKRRGVRTSLPAGTRVGRYTIVDRIGAGGMAELFLARQDGPRGFAKPIALKLLHAHIAEDPEFVAMFEREARVAAALVHPNIAQVLDIGVEEDEHFLALEFVHGRDLRRLLVAQRGPLPLGCAIRIVADVAKALQYVHTRCDPRGRPLDLVHRDVSPANVLVGFAGSVKLADFGIAKAADQTAHTRTGTLKGKFGYMAPEQYLQQAVDPRSDLFALGVVLYEATTGRRAFAGAQTFSIMNRVLAGDYAAPGSVVPDYPPALAAIVARLLSVDPALRPASAQAVIDELEDFASSAGIDARDDTLAAFVSALFDHPAEPSLDAPELPSTSTGLATLPGDETLALASTRKRTRLPRMAALATIGVFGIVVGGVGGWRMARGDETPLAPARESFVAAPAQPTAPIETQTPLSRTVTDEPTASASAPAATLPLEPVADPPRRTANKSRRRAEPSRRAARDESSADLSEMFPKAMQ
jgi:serine/threonine-protein kinase